jgi:hypothetical protein
MTSIYLPSNGPHDWQWLLAKPGLHWKHGASAMALADAWEHADGWPQPVAEALAGDDQLAGLELLVAFPEHQVPLPGGQTASQSDLFVLARSPEGDLVTIAVEGKAAEPFGDSTVSAWRATDTPGRRERLAYLLEVLGLDDDDRVAGIRYQLLHRTASAVIEARRFGATHAVMLVHSFSPKDAWLEDFLDFASLCGAAQLAKGGVAPVREIGAITLHLGWVSDTPRPLVSPPRLGPRFDRALALARELHGDQVRKGTEIPYVSHLMGVASLVIDDGGDEDEAIAALLHDAVEDQGGEVTLGLIRQQFGNHVADIVKACSDTDVQPKPPWRARKDAYLGHLHDPALPAGTLRVSLADKLHNARAILFDLRSGQDVFSRFSASREETHRYYDELAKAFAELTDSPMMAELRIVVNELLSHQPQEA